jgi:hypothetical protein
MKPLQRSAMRVQCQRKGAITLFMHSGTGLRTFLSAALAMVGDITGCAENH